VREILNISEKFIFVHIPKTAGTSFRKLLTDIFGEDQVSLQFSGKRLTDDDAVMLDKFQVIAGHIGFADIEKYFPNRRLITILREPVDRCLSIYGFLREKKELPLIPMNEIKDGANPFEVSSLAKQLSPDDFFNANHPRLLQRISNRMVWQFGFHTNHDNRAKYSDGEILVAAKSNLKKCDFVGFFENLDSDAEHLLQKFNLNGNISLSKNNPTLAPIRKNQISAELHKKISALNTLDSELYQWAKCEFGSDQ
jgi:hypothetical protein